MNLPPKVNVIDFETTDKDAKKCHPIEFAAVSADREFTTFIKCPVPIPPETSAIHHIVAADIEADTLAKTWDDLRITILNPPEGTIYVAHNAKYEQGVIGEGYEALSWICTYKVALRLWPDAPNHKNETLRYHLGLGQLGRSASQQTHSALHDCRVTSLILIEALQYATLQEMVQWTSEPAQYSKIMFGKYAGSKWDAIDLGYLQWICKQADMDIDIVACAAREIQRRREASSATPRPR